MNAIFVLGTGRSGTSALAGCLHRLGGFCGNNLRVGDSFNQKGYYENLKVSRLNDYILSAKLKTPWYCTSPDNIKGVEPEPETLQLIRDAIYLDYSGRNVVVIKEPRLCLFFKCYETIFKEWGYNIECIRTHRDELEVIKSLIPAYPHLTENSAKMILDRHNNILDSYLGSTEYLTIDYSSLIHYTDRTIEQLKSYLPFLDYSELNIKYIKDFLDPSLKHH